MTDLSEMMLENQLHIGDIVGDTKRIVIACQKIRDRVPGDSYAAWVAICAKDGEYHPYVVWYVYATRNGFHAELGDYCFTLKEALEAYNGRIGKND